MIKELSWYIEDNRFTDIVNEIDLKADLCLEALKNEADDRLEKRTDFLNLIQGHVDNCGLKLGTDVFTYLDEKVFGESDINRDELEKLEKNIVKAYMYQKLLWEYMGTTGHFSVISKTSMEKNGYKYEDYLPISYREEHQPKSPISNILAESENVVPIYMYNDGMIGTVYDERRAKFHLDSLRDRSGFDWNKKGWDPNYEVDKSGWAGTFNRNGEWVLRREAMEGLKTSTIEVAEVPAQDEFDFNIELIKDGDGAILYDPFYCFLLSYIYVDILGDDVDIEPQIERIAEIKTAVRDALAKIGAKKITSIVRNPLDGRMESFVKSGNVLYERLKDESKVIRLYQIVLGDEIDEKPAVRDISDARAIQRKEVKAARHAVQEEVGKKLSENIRFVASQGYRGKELFHAVKDGSMKMPLSHRSERDCAWAGLTQEEFEILKAYDIPETKEKTFDKVLFNVLLNYDLLATGGLTKPALFEKVYDKVVLGKSANQQIDVETTLGEILNKPNALLSDADISADITGKFENLRADLSVESTPELRAKRDKYIDNAIKSYRLISENLNMSERDVFDIALSAFRSDNFDYDSGIAYKPVRRPGSGASEQRLFATLSLDDIIESAEKSDFVKRERGYSADIDIKYSASAEIASADVPNVVDMLDAEQLEQWFGSSEFQSTGLSREDVVALAEASKASNGRDVGVIDASIATKVYSAVPLPGIQALKRRVDVIEAAKAANEVSAPLQAETQVNAKSDVAVAYDEHETSVGEGAPVADVTGTTTAARQAKTAANAAEATTAARQAKTAANAAEVSGVSADAGQTQTAGGISNGEVSKALGVAKEDDTIRNFSDFMKYFGEGFTEGFADGAYYATCFEVGWNIGTFIGKKLFAKKPNLDAEYKRRADEVKKSFFEWAEKKGYYDFDVLTDKVAMNSLIAITGWKSEGNEQNPIDYFYTKKYGKDNKIDGTRKILTEFDKGVLVDSTIYGYEIPNPIAEAYPFKAPVFPLVYNKENDALDKIVKRVTELKEKKAAAVARIKGVIAKSGGMSEREAESKVNLFFEHWAEENGYVYVSLEDKEPFFMEELALWGWDRENGNRDFYEYFLNEANKIKDEYGDSSLTVKKTPFKLRSDEDILCSIKSRERVDVLISSSDSDSSISDAFVKSDNDVDTGFSGTVGPVIDETASLDDVRLNLVDLHYEEDRKQLGSFASWVQEQETKSMVDGTKKHLRKMLLSDLINDVKL